MRLTKSAGVVMGLTVGCLVSWPWVDAWRVRSRIRPHADASALSHFDQLGVWRRAEVGREALEAIARLKRSGWTPRLTGLEARGEDGDDARFVYSLATSTIELLDCRGIEGADAIARCGAFSHAIPGRPHDRVLQLAPLEVDLNAAQPKAASAGSVALRIGQGKVAAQARVEFDGEDVRALDPALRVARPSDPGEIDVVPIDGAFSLTGRDERRVLWSRAYTFEIAHDLPPGLAAIFGGEHLVVIRASAALRVDLHQATPVLRAEAGLVLLNHHVIDARFAYWPGEYLALQLRGASVPTPIPGVSARLDGADLEIDIRQRRLRLAGQASVGLGVLVPVADGAPWTARLGHAFTDWALTSGARHLGLPSDASAQALLVIDWDDGQVCLDLGLQGTSVVHVASLGDGQLRVWAPVVYEGPMPEGPFDGLMTMGALAAAPWAGPQEVDLRHCHPGDSGSRAGLGAITP